VWRGPVPRTWGPGHGWNTAGRARLGEQRRCLREARFPAWSDGLSTGHGGRRGRVLVQRRARAVVEESERIVSDASDAHVGDGTLPLVDRSLWGPARWHRLHGKASICCRASTGASPPGRPGPVPGRRPRATPGTGKPERTTAGEPPSFPSSDLVAVGDGDGPGTSGPEPEFGS
jgi:hypothetical protein